MTALTSFVAFAATAPVFAGSFVLPPQGESPFADTEASTNLVFGTLDGGQGRKVFNLALSLFGTPSNCFQIAFGRDVDRNGVLEPSETDIVYGWRAGRYVVEDVPGRKRILSKPVEAVGGRELRVHIEAGGDYTPRRISLTCDGSPAFTGLAATLADGLLRPGWDMVRVTRRGAGLPSDWVSCELTTHGLSVFIR